MALTVAVDPELELALLPEFPEEPKEFDDPSDDNEDASAGVVFKL